MQIIISIIKNDPIAKCEEFGFTKCKSKNKNK